MISLDRVLIYLYIVTFALDFKGAEAGGSIIQFLFLSITLAAAALLLFGLYKQPVKFAIPQQVANLNKLWWLFLLSTILTMQYNQVSLSNYIRVLMPYLLAGISSFLVLMLYSRGKQLKELYKPILIAVFISVFWTPMYALVILHIPMSEMRYQILSPVLPLLLAYFITLFYLKKISSFKTIFVAFICLTLIVLSVTRGNILILAFLGLFLLVSLPKSSRNMLLSKVMTVLLPTLLLLVIFIPFIEFIRPDILATWSLRLFGANAELGFDPTALTRLSEYSGQMDLLFESPITTMLGRGLGSVYFWDDEYFNLISQVIPLWKLEEATPWFSGHSVWVYSLYSGGFLFGLIVPYCLLKSMIFSWYLIRNHLIQVQDDSEIILLFYSLMSIAVIAVSFTANPFGERIVGLLFGFGLVLPLLFKHQVLLSRE